LKKFIINNMPINSADIKEIELILDKTLDSTTSPNLITTFNLDFLRVSASDIDFFNICQNSLYNFPDGFGITSLILLKYKILIQRFTGNDIFPILLQIAKKKNLKVAIIGGTKEVSLSVYNKISTEFDFSSSNLLCISPLNNFEYDFAQNKLVVEKLKEFKPNIVFAALGCPRQEKWLFNHMNEFGSVLNVGIGATLDYFAGKKKRSPKFLQRIGLEWFWRLLNEPKRLFKRYVVKDIPFYFKNVVQILRG